MKIIHSALAVASLLALGASAITPSESERYRQAALRDPEFRPAEKISFYQHYDFAPLLTQADPYGFIGPHYQRLHLKVLTARQDKANPVRYYLTGRAMVLGHLSNFGGTLVLRQARELRQLAYNGEAASDATQQAFRGAQREGFVLGDYKLREQASQPNAGVFRGVARLNWYVNRWGRLRYDMVYGEGDGYCNNQFVGTWTSYASGQTLRCNWGDYRIPNSGNFDIGAGEFSPDPKYYSYGWQNFAALYSGTGDAEQALKREARTWWK